MFTYCLNNPANRVDSGGTISYVSGADEFNPLALPWEYSGGGSGGGGIGIPVIPLVDPLMVADLKELDEAKAEALALKQTSQESYTVYFLCKIGDTSKTIIYVGRVKTSNFAARMAYHKSKGRQLVDKIDGLSYEVCRALEQAGMMFYHTINRTAAINNQIRGISPQNGNRHAYLLALLEIIGKGMYTGENCIPSSYLMNLTEEMFLNGTP